MSMDAELRKRLTIALQPQRLDVINESHLHAGHRDAPGTGESHYRVLIVSSRFTGVSRVGRHRLVNETLGDLVGGRIHALALATYAPGEPLP
jgi:BolA family transcriptional regulator, general stress-responsive regulator